MNVYVDIDGVVLGGSGADTCLAPYAQEFLEYVSEHFNGYWLTTHCRGDLSGVLRRLRPFADDAVLAVADRLQPTYFHTLKMEALEGEFVWVDDAPLRVEIDWLGQRGMLDRWIQVDTRRRPDDLLHAIRRLEVLREPR